MTVPGQVWWNRDFLKWIYRRVMLRNWGCSLRPARGEKKNRIKINDCAARVRRDSQEDDDDETAKLGEKTYLQFTWCQLLSPPPLFLKSRCRKARERERGRMTGWYTLHSQWMPWARDGRCFRNEKNINIIGARSERISPPRDSFFPLFYLLFSLSWFFAVCSPLSYILFLYPYFYFLSLFFSSDASPSLSPPPSQFRAAPAEK